MEQITLPQAITSDTFYGPGEAVWNEEFEIPLGPTRSADSRLHYNCCVRSGSSQFYLDWPVRASVDLLSFTQTGGTSGCVGSNAEPEPPALIIICTHGVGWYKLSDNPMRDLGEIYMDLWFTVRSGPSTVESQSTNMHPRILLEPPRSRSCRRNG